METKKEIIVNDKYFDNVKITIKFKKNRAYKDEYYPREEYIICAILQGLSENKCLGKLQ